MPSTRVLTCLGLAAGLSLGTVAAREPADSAQNVRPLLVGAKVPAVTVRTLDGEPFDLQRGLDGERAVLIFYRGGW